jgi:hypothetical protein
MNPAVTHRHCHGHESTKPNHRAQHTLGLIPTSVAQKLQTREKKFENEPQIFRARQSNVGC